MKVLVSNVGSTSLKFKLFEMPEETVLCEAKVERVGSMSNAIYSYRNPCRCYAEKKENLSVPDYSSGIKLFLDSMLDEETGVLDTVEDIKVVGFKTVLAKGYYGVHELTGDVLDAMKEYLFVAPVHNAAYLEAIGQFKSILPEARMIGVFETAFHTTIPKENRMYSIPYEWFEKYGIMKMGYHGASHSYIADRTNASKVISCHLGGSCSICAIKDGKSIDTSFGFSLQTGVMHANRVGDIDPYLVPFLLDCGMDFDEIIHGLSKNGGLQGVSGISNDVRILLEEVDNGNARAKLAIDMLTLSIVRYIGMFYAELGGLDKLVFTGGIGENSDVIREKVCAGLAHMGIVLDREANSACRGEGVISAADSPVEVLVIAANEELGVCRRTFEYISR